MYLFGGAGGGRASSPRQNDLLHAMNDALRFVLRIDRCAQSRFVVVKEFFLIEGTMYQSIVPCTRYPPGCDTTLLILVTIPFIIAWIFPWHVNSTSEVIWCGESSSRSSSLIVYIGSRYPGRLPNVHGQSSA